MSFKRSILILLCILINTKCNDYCDQPCGKEHTLCKRNAEFCGLSTKCPANTEIQKYSDSERKEILDRHNTLRNNLALGLDTRGNNSKAADMNALYYDLELEFIAQCWTNTCHYGHDTCRSTIVNKEVGQNIYHGVNDNTLIEKAVESWYEEIVSSRKSYVDKHVPAARIKCGAFTQLVWAKTIGIGCGRTIIEKNAIVVCNYGPSGNIAGEETYTRGDPCSKCVKNITCHKKYKGLCGLSYIDSSFNEPFLMNSHRIQNDKIITILVFGVFILHSLINN